MEYYHGPGRRGAYFEGWYLKHQGPEGELALIPAIHQRRGGERSATIQVITADQTRIFSFPERAFQAWADQFKVRVSGNWFSQDGVYVDLEEGDFSLKGELRYGPFTRLESDIMGPFRRVPAMECVHTVLSMAHPLEGLLCLNGRYLDFSHGTGYIEGDIVPQDLPVDAVLLARAPEGEHHALYCPHPYSGGRVYRLYLSDMVRRQILPDGHLPGSKSSPVG